MRRPHRPYGEQTGSGISGLPLSRHHEEAPSAENADGASFALISREVRDSLGRNRAHARRRRMGLMEGTSSTFFARSRISVKEYVRKSGAVPAAPRILGKRGSQRRRMAPLPLPKYRPTYRNGMSASDPSPAGLRYAFHRHEERPVPTGGPEGG